MLVCATFAFPVFPIFMLCRATYDPSDTSGSNPMSNTQGNPWPPATPMGNQRVWISPWLLVYLFTLRQTNIATENPRFVDIFPIGKGGFPLPCSFTGRYSFLISGRSGSSIFFNCHIHPGRLTWNLKIPPLEEDNHLPRPIIFRFPGGVSITYLDIYVFKDLWYMKFKDTPVDTYIYIYVTFYNILYHLCR